MYENEVFYLQDCMKIYMNEKKKIEGIVLYIFVILIFYIKESNTLCARIKSLSCMTMKDSIFDDGVLLLSKSDHYLY